MLNFSYEEALKNFPSLVDNVINRHEVVTFERAAHESVVMLSKDDYESFQFISCEQTSSSSIVSSPDSPQSTSARTHNSLDDWF